MEWIKAFFGEHSVIQAIVVISMICALGLACGKIRLWGVSLGVTFVFFWGILGGHIGLDIDPQMRNFAESFGLILFVYALGLQVGPAFFSSFGKAGLRLNMLAMTVILLGAALTVAFHFATGISLPDMVGILCGAVTNTPALGAAQQTLKQVAVADPTLSQTDLTLGCAVAYPLGVVGVIVALVFLRKLYPATPCQGAAEKSKTLTGGFRITNPQVYGRTVQQVAESAQCKFLISRISRQDAVQVPQPATVLQEGDDLLVTFSPKDKEWMTDFFGQYFDFQEGDRRIDWSVADRRLLSRRILVTRAEVNGKKLGTLKLRNIHGVNITKVHRAGVQLLPTSDLTLQLGDRITIVGEEKSVSDVQKLLGNAPRSLNEPNLVAVFVGVMLGLLLGSIPVAFPGIGFPIRLGIAGGPIIAGILMGAFGARFHLITYTTPSANLMLRGLGISLYLACLGLEAGVHFFETVFRPEGLLWIGLGFLLTVVPVLTVALFARRFMQAEYGAVAGMLCGSMTNPMALNFVNTIVESDQPSVSYATVYPMSMFLRVIIAQLLVMLFL